MVGSNISYSLQSTLANMIKDQSILDGISGILISSHPVRTDPSRRHQPGADGTPGYSLPVLRRRHIGAVLPPLTHLQLSQQRDKRDAARRMHLTLSSRSRGQPRQLRWRPEMTRHFRSGAHVQSYRRMPSRDCIAKGGQISISNRAWFSFSLLLFFFLSFLFSFLGSAVHTESNKLSNLSLHQLGRAHLYADLR